MVTTTFMYINAILAILFVGFAMWKKLDIIITLFGAGLFLLYSAAAMGYTMDVTGFEGTGFVAFDPLEAVVRQFIVTMQQAGIVILFLGGYTSYMSQIGANNETIKLFTKPLSKIKSPYILVPFTFLFGNLLSLVVPSASMLAIILLATLYPLLRESGMSKLTGAAVIATTATVMPTPLGSDNVVIAKELGMSVTEYVFRYHAIISIPTLFFMALVHYFTQKFMDKRDIKKGNFEKIEDVDQSKKVKSNLSKKWGWVYALMPLLPIIILVIVFIVNISTPNSADINLSVAVAVSICLLVAMLIEGIRIKSPKEALNGSKYFFDGMGSAISVVVLTAAASVFVAGLKSVKLIETLQDALTGLSGNGMGWVLPLALVLLTALIVLLSGSGTSLFFALAPLVVVMSSSAGIPPEAISVPMGLAGNLLRAVSPVAAVIIITAGQLKLSPMAIVKRTAIPMVAGTIFMFALSMIVFL